MKSREQKIKDIQNGTHAIENDGTVDELREVLKECFPKDKDNAEGTDKFYFTYEVFDKDWFCSNKTDLPSYTVTELIQPQFKRGDRVMVSDCLGRWSNSPRIYLTTIEGAEFPHMCVTPFHEEDFKNGEMFSITRWKHIKPIEEEKLEITVTINGKEVSPSEISEETWKNLRQ